MNITHFLDTLNQMFPDAKAELNYSNPFELLIAVVLSAQTTDKAVNKVTEQLFANYPNPLALSEAQLSDVENIIKTIGLYHNKAKNIIALSKELVDKYQGEVPQEREQLESLPGVGRKTTNVVISNAFGIPALAVDTHVARISVRLGLAKATDNVLEIEKKLNRKIPKEHWLKVHHQMIFFGRYHCLAKNPKCQSCPLIDDCKYKDKQK
ncbi:endonuclease III [Paracholeplasma manati]|uniref:endonuclease III n=1 Tax=Paracholeplasma manati TaxID=591373 RepID=UPI00240832D3|nr:endonuclease III [Paracholeplasma manati]MDG0888532.1 endonuclease III [Paracholeplasma manati]